jgi:hypothetical protein
VEQFRRRGKLIPRLRASIVLDRPADEDVVQVLNLYHFCKTFHALPTTGGVLDQNFRVMLLFEAVSEAESEREIREQEKRDRKAGNRAGNRT